MVHKKRDTGLSETLLSFLILRFSNRRGNGEIIIWSGTMWSDQFSRNFFFHILKDVIMCYVEIDKNHMVLYLVLDHVIISQEKDTRSNWDSFDFLSLLHHPASGVDPHPIIKMKMLLHSPSFLHSYSWSSYVYMNNTVTLRLQNQSCHLQISIDSEFFVLCLSLGFLCTFLQILKY